MTASGPAVASETVSHASAENGAGSSPTAVPAPEGSSAPDSAGDPAPVDADPSAAAGAPPASNGEAAEDSVVTAEPLEERAPDSSENGSAPDGTASTETGPAPDETAPSETETASTETGPAPDETAPSAPAVAESAPRYPTEGRPGPDDPRLHEAIRELRGAIDLVGVMIATSDGLALAYDLPTDDSLRIAAMAATGLGLGRRLVDSFGHERFQEQVTRGSDGYFVVYSAGRDAVLAVIAPASSNLGMLHHHARRLATRLGDLLAGPSA